MRKVKYDERKKSRSATRRYAMEVLYQHFLTDDSISDILDRYSEKSRVDYPYLQEIVKGSMTKKKDIDQAIEAKMLDRALNEVSHVEYAILLLSSYELMCLYDVPYRVVINEAINLSKQYGAQDSHKFINSVLDRLAADTRGLECDK